MLLELKVFQEACKQILEAVDSNSFSVESESLELKTEGDFLFLNVTNMEYYTSVKIPLNTNVGEFSAVVEAKLFLNLISRLTTKDVELTISNNALIIKSNGEYKIPMNDAKLQRIEIGNVTNQFTVSNNVLQSILRYNDKELQKSGLQRATKKFFYVDQFGAITQTSGACVNSFTLPQPIQILLPQKIVKLFKLFNSEDVELTLGYDEVSGMSQTKIRLRNDTIEITAILMLGDSALKDFAVDTIRGAANIEFDYSAIINKDEVLSSLSRLSLFTSNITKSIYTFLKFTNKGVQIFDTNEVNSEVINYETEIPGSEFVFETAVEANDLIMTLNNCEEKFVKVNFGHEAILAIARGNIINIIAECQKQE